MKNLYIDIETSCCLPVNTVGVYRFSEDDDFRIFLISYAVDNSPVKIVDILHGENLNAEITAMLSDDHVIKYAYDAQYVRVCISRHLGLPLDCFLPPEQWRCLKSQALSQGFPDEKSHVEEMLGINGSICAEARSYIRKFCQSNLDEEDAGFMSHTAENSTTWRFLRESLCADTYVTRQLAESLKQYPMDESDLEAYFTNERINDHGVLVERKLVENAIRCNELFRAIYSNRLQNITGLENSGSAGVYRAWLESQGIHTGSLSRSSIRRLLLTAKPPVRESLEIWQHLAKASTQKYMRIRSALCGDNRLRGLFVFAGCKSGRFGSAVVQVGNLPVSKSSALHEMRKHVRYDDYYNLDELCQSVTEALSQLLATAFIPPKGHILTVIEFPKLEERILHWLAEQDDGTCFDYPDESMYSQIDHHREPAIRRLWWDLECATKLCLLQSTSTRSHGISFCDKNDIMDITLPSGRTMSYRDALCTSDVNGNTFISYEGYGEKRRWQLNIIDGSNIANDIAQGIARDILVEAMNRLRPSGHAVVMHTPDLLILESPGNAESNPVYELTGLIPDWAYDIPIALHCYNCDSYYKRSADRSSI